MPDIKDRFSLGWVLEPRVEDGTVVWYFTDGKQQRLANETEVTLWRQLCRAKSVDDGYDKVLRDARASIPREGELAGRAKIDLQDDVGHVLGTRVIAADVYRLPTGELRFYEA